MFVASSKVCNGAV